MTSKTMQASILAVALAGALVTAALAQTPPMEGDPHHPADAQAAEAQSATPGDVTPMQAQGGMPQGMAGMMGMMTPEMMQMMHSMMGQGRIPDMMGQGGGMPGMMGQGSGAPGMMGQGGGAPGMMGQGGGAPGMMGQGGGAPGMMGQGGKPGMMGQGIMDGAGLLYGLPSGEQEEVTPEQVRLWLQRELVRHGNPRLAIGEIIGDDDSITATIVTVDGSLVQKLAFNRFPGLVRQVVD